MTATLHFDLSVHNSGIQQYMRHSDETDRVFPHSHNSSRGMMHPGDAPGLGVDVDESLAAKYPLPQGVPACESPARRHHAQLVGGCRSKRTVSRQVPSTVGVAISLRPLLSPAEWEL